jgi:hypothetical protein
MVMGIVLLVLDELIRLGVLRRPQPDRSAALKPEIPISAAFPIRRLAHSDEISVSPTGAEAVPPAGDAISPILGRLD